MTLQKFYRALTFASALFLANIVRSEGLLITCATSEACDFKAVAVFRIDGRDAVRIVAAKNIASVTVSALRATRERKIDGLQGIVRNLGVGLVQVYGTSDENPEMVFPGGSVPKDAAMIPGVWNNVQIGYRDSLKAKKDIPVAVRTFAGYLVGHDAADLAVSYARRLVAGPSSAWRAALLQGAIRFGRTAPSYKAWRDQLFSSLRDGLAQYRKQEGDPRQLGNLLNNAIRDGEILRQIEPTDTTYANVLAEAHREQDTLNKKVAIASAFAAGEFWDEYVVKIHEIGLAKWSIPNLVANERSALIASAKSHRSNSAKMAQSGFFDRAFDEAERAYRRDPCSLDVAINFNNIRPQFVERRKVSQPADIIDVNRSALQQIERQLRSLDPTQLQQESYRKLGYDLIARGDAVDRTYAPFQLAKAQFLRSVSRLSDALDVAIYIQRYLSLDSRQREELLSLDANLSLGLTAVRNRAFEDAQAHFDAGRFREALDSTTPGLAADPNSPKLLFLRGSAAASLRQPDEAIRSINTLLKASPASCADPGTYEKAFLLTDALGPAPTEAKTQTAEPGEGIPSWMSGKKYSPGNLYYDPVSLAFLPRVTMLNGVKNPPITTVFTWEGLRLVSIETSLHLLNSKSGNGQSSSSGQTMFFAEPEYAPGTLRMTAVGPRAIQEGKRISHPLTFWNDPRVNVSLLQTSGRIAARGWSGNPVFDPLVWSGIYLFDFKYDNKGRVIEAIPVPDETRGRSFTENLTFTWDDATNRLKSISSRSYRRVIEYDSRGRIVSEEATFGKLKAKISYQYSGESAVPHRASGKSVFDQQERLATFQQGN